MAPLYKRYIPPKAPEITPSIPSVPQQGPDEKKRKRERSEEEIALRKAKKLKSNGLPVPSSTKPTPSTAQNPASSDTSLKVPETKHDEQPTQPKGDFAHIKNIKKRHKLEKEARKAKKAAAKETPEVEAEESLPTIDEQRLVPQEVVPVSGEVGNPEVKSTCVDTIEKQAIPNRKKRRHRLEAILQDEPEDTEEHLQKHTGIIGKFHKAIQDHETSEEPSHSHIEESKVVVHDLKPLPQPAPNSAPLAEPTYSALPPWLEKPIVCPLSAIPCSFGSLGLDPSLVTKLSQLQFRDALPVQQSVIPLLLRPGLPGATYSLGSDDIIPDLAISAPTGSGKTLAYLLPIIEALKTCYGSGQLKALVVVPTRELVSQVAAIADSLAKGSNIAIGMATGTGKLRDEQDRLITRGRIYDPSGYGELMAKAQARNYAPSSPLNDDEAEVDETMFETDQQEIVDLAITGVPNHVPTFRSAVDILICTPGRLLEHLNNTVGFSVAHLEWLVLDEADKLLNQQYDGFIASLSDKLNNPRAPHEQNARELFLRSRGSWNEFRERRIRKVLLSATMTRDISKLLPLKLRRPQLLVVEGSDRTGQSTKSSDLTPSFSAEAGGVFELPKNLVEFCIPVGDGSEKPLHLVELLRSRIIPREFAGPEITTTHRARRKADSSDSDSSMSSAVESDTTSESDTDSSSESSISSSESDADLSAKQTTLAKGIMHPSRTALLAAGTETSGQGCPTVVVFTSSNEACDRLAHLLKLVQPQWSTWITSLTKSRKMASFKTERKFPSIIISTDRAARGLDTISNRRITHVIQYDIPRSLEGYVHRVGRTARAGRDGEAYTLYTHREAHWFLHEVTRTEKLKRKEVERLKIPVRDDDLTQRYTEALDQMRSQVFGSSK